MLLESQKIHEPVLFGFKKEKSICFYIYHNIKQ